MGKCANSSQKKLKGLWRRAEGTIWEPFIMQYDIKLPDFLLIPRPHMLTYCEPSIHFNLLCIFRWFFSNSLGYKTTEAK